MNKATKTDYDNLKAVLLDLGRADYENARAGLIAALGYDQFRALQNKVFKEIGTLKFERTWADERAESYITEGNEQ